MPIITLTTDFGLRDWFVGTMKGVILSIQPGAALVDICHEIPPGDIRAGAFALAASCRYFPKGTVHLAVVDPGVGSERKAVAVRTPDGCFVGPDNGVLSWALRHQKILSAHSLENSSFFRVPISQTFHGRDVFAPVAAHLSRGVPLRKFGPALSALVRLEWPEPRHRDGKLEGEVIYVDRFGNAITNIDGAALAEFGGAAVTISRGRRPLASLARCYSAVRKKSPVAVLGSSGFLEVAVNGGNAARELGLRAGTVITISAALRRRA